MTRTHADLVVRNARPWSAGGVEPGADSIAVGGERILALGPHAAVSTLIGPGTEVIDAGGATVTPGITDAHIHLVQWARAEAEVALRGAASAADAAARVARFAARHPGNGPLVGRGWDANGWSDAPHRAALDAAYRLKPDRRILLAVEAVRFFVAGSPGSATAIQEGERWRIRLGPADVGTLRDLQDC